MEEDIRFLEEKLDNIYVWCGCSIRNAIERVLNELERLQKEFEVLDRECSRWERKENELEKEVKDWQRAFQEEKDEQFNMLIKKCLHCGNDTPLYCETCYQELISKNAELQSQVNMLDETYTKAIQESKKWFDIAYDSIPKQIIRDKIQLLEKELKLLDKKDSLTLMENDSVIYILKELLKN